MDEKHLHDYVWMKPLDGGPPEKVSTAGDEISKKMWAGYVQTDPPAEPEARPVLRGPLESLLGKKEGN